MILVTGGAGYIGSRCVIELLDNGYDVVIFDNLSTGSIKTIQNLRNCGKFEFIKGDLTYSDDILNVFKNYNIDSVIHFAAFSQVGESVNNPQKYYYNNVFGTMNLLNAMIKNNVLKIVFSSTAAVYGNPQYLPIDENHPLNPVNPYGNTKYVIERILDDYDKACKLRSVRLRYFNAAGADSLLRTGECHNPETHLIPNILRAVSEKEFNLYGDDYDTKDGTCIRDYINIEDLACAHLTALEYLEAGGKTDFFNLGTNEGSSVREVFSICEEIKGEKIPVKTCPRRDGDPPVLVADNSKAKKILNWYPQKSLRLSIQTAYNWEIK